MRACVSVCVCVCVCVCVSVLVPPPLFFFGSNDTCLSVVPCSPHVIEQDDLPACLFSSRFSPQYVCLYVLRTSTTRKKGGDGGGGS